VQRAAAISAERVAGARAHPTAHREKQRHHGCTVGSASCPKINEIVPDQSRSEAARVARSSSRQSWRSCGSLIG
jgi:hypothetical protein